MVEEFAEGRHAERAGAGAPPGATRRDDYDEVVEGSFPASDAPSTTPVTSVGGPDR